MDQSRRKGFFDNPFVLTVIAIALGSGVAALILLLAGFPPVESLKTLVTSMVGRPKDISSVIIRSTPIIEYPAKDRMPAMAITPTDTHM